MQQQFFRWEKHIFASDYNSCRKKH
jgi:hypothetical protein